jgi:hypothetical protein
MFSLQKYWRARGQNRFCLEEREVRGGGREGGGCRGRGERWPNNVYTYD